MTTSKITFLIGRIVLLITSVISTSAYCNVELTGINSYSPDFAAGTVTLNIEKLTNTSSSSSTAPLRFEFWLTSTRYLGGGIRGYKVASMSIGSSNGKLEANQYYSNISAALPLSGLPANGSYYATLIVSEFSQNCGSVDGYCLDTIYADFQNKFVIGTITGGTSVASQNVKLTGNYSYSADFAEGTVTVNVDQLSNTSSTSTTGPLRLELWLTSAPYAGGYISGDYINGYKVASIIPGSSNGQLEPNQSFSNISATLPLSGLPAGGVAYSDGTSSYYRYYATLVVTEQSLNCGSTDSYCIDTYGAFQNIFLVPAKSETTGPGSNSPVFPYAKDLLNGLQASEKILTFANPTDCLFNWLEDNYPSYISPHRAVSLGTNQYYYRYYTATNSYVGVSSANSHLYYMGATAGLIDLGLSATWSTQAGCK